jgi:hypothetical protein
MQISLVDWIVVFAHFALSLGFSSYYDRRYDRRANGALANFWSSAEAYPWRLAKAGLNNVLIRIGHE